MKYNHYRIGGFTIVELLIVIVVIGILAAVSIVAYNGVQVRARDNIRARDLASIKKALIAYDIEYGGVKRVSAYAGSHTYSGWDASVSPNWLSFLRSGFGNMPIDPVNQLNNDNAPNNTNRLYFYHCYFAGTGSHPSLGADYARIGYQKESGDVVYEVFVVGQCQS